MKTFADSTKTPGQYIDDRCYVLAQLPETANLDWARDLRGVLGGAELKYQKYLSLRHRVQSNKALWKRVLDGTAEATIVVIENSFYIDAIAYNLKCQGAELGHDVSFEDILRRAALCMIGHSPVMRLPDLASDMYTYPTLRTRRYAPEGVFQMIGGKFNDAAVFAVRAHAVFDIDALEKTPTTNELFFGPYKQRLMSDIDGIDRVFDQEHPKSAAMLNEMFSSYDALSNNAPVTRVCESTSESNDALQAADFCAGFASECMMNASDDRERELRRHFRRVIFNGATR